MRFDYSPRGVISRRFKSVWRNESINLPDRVLGRVLLEKSFDRMMNSVYPVIVSELNRAPAAKLVYLPFF